MDSKEVKLSPVNFLFGTTLGEGSFAKVIHVVKKGTREEFACKIMDRKFIAREKKEKFVMKEKQVLAKLCHPRIVKLDCTFKDSTYIYMVMELCHGGELLTLINENHQEQILLGNTDQACSFEVARFYTAEIIQALEYLHSNGIVHRDLKPENILLSRDGHTKIIDFGSVKDISSSKDDATTSFCGTAEYVSPEVLRDDQVTSAADLWALGCIIYQLFVGRPLFRDHNEYLIFQQILRYDSKNTVFPEHMPDVAVDLCRKLLKQSPSERIGMKSYNDLQNHPFFDGLDWEKLQVMEPPYPVTKKILPIPIVDGMSRNWELASILSDSSLLVMLRFLHDGEDIVLSSLVRKRNGIFYSTRQLILTTGPRLIYVDPYRMKLRGEIPWSTDLYLHAKSETSFDILTDRHRFHITDRTYGSKGWQNAINSILEVK